MKVLHCICSEQKKNLLIASIYNYCNTYSFKIVSNDVKQYWKYSDYTEIETIFDNMISKEELLRLFINIVGSIDDKEENNKYSSYYHYSNYNNKNEVFAHLWIE